jgi:nucleotide-binding universal stress UspA family protein
VGLDGSKRAEQALEQALVLGRRFGATIIAAHARKSSAPSGAELLERARARVTAAGLKCDVVERDGDADVELADLARDADACLVGRVGQDGAGDLGPTVAALIRTAERCVIVCGGAPSPMASCALAYDGGDTSKRALALVAQFASITGSMVHVIHANDDREAGLLVVGDAEAELSRQRVPFLTHIEAGTPGEVCARVMGRTRGDALFVGAHVSRGRNSGATAGHAAEILRHTDIPVVVQP